MPHAASVTQVAAAERQLLKSGSSLTAWYDSASEDALQGTGSEPMRVRISTDFTDKDDAEEEEYETGVVRADQSFDTLPKQSLVHDPKLKTMNSLVSDQDMMEEASFSTRATLHRMGTTFTDQDLSLFETRDLKRMDSLASDPDVHIIKAASGLSTWYTEDDAADDATRAEQSFNMPPVAEDSSEECSFSTRATWNRMGTMHTDQDLSLYESQDLKRRDSLFSEQDAQIIKSASGLSTWYTTGDVADDAIKAEQSFNFLSVTEDMTDDTSLRTLTTWTKMGSICTDQDLSLYESRDLQKRRSRRGSVKSNWQKPEQEINKRLIRGDSLSEWWEPPNKVDKCLQRGETLSDWWQQDDGTMSFQLSSSLSMTPSVSQASTRSQQSQPRAITVDGEPDAELEPQDSKLSIIKEGSDDDMSAKDSERSSTSVVEPDAEEMVDGASAKGSKGSNGKPQHVLSATPGMAEVSREPAEPERKKCLTLWEDFEIGVGNCTQALLELDFFWSPFVVGSFSKFASDCPDSTLESRQAEREASRESRRMRRVQALAKA